MNIFSINGDCFTNNLRQSDLLLIQLALLSHLALAQVIRSRRCKFHAEIGSDTSLVASY